MLDRPRPPPLILEFPLRRHLPTTFACALLLALSGCGGGGDDDKATEAKGKDGKPPIGASDGFKAQKGLVSAKASASEGAAVEDYVPEGEIIADSGFRPDPDGFAFENYGNDVGPENLGPTEVENLFGEQVCISGTGTKCKLTPAAQEWMENQNEGMAGGHCQGFSVTALRMYNENLDVTEFGADAPADLEIQGNVDLQTTIAENFTYQFLSPIIQERVKGTPTKVLERLAQALEEGDELYTLGIYKPDLSGGHAITPFAIEDKGDGQMAILVYDNNFPGVTRAVDVDTNEDTWKYVASTNPSEAASVYKGDATTGTLELDPTLPVEEEYAPCTFCGAEQAGGDEETKGTLPDKKDRFTEITLGGDPRNHPHLVFTDDDGKRTGIVDGKFLQEIPDVEVIKTYAVQNWKGAPEPRFRLPEGKEYVITVDGTDLKKATTASIDLVGNGLVIEVDNIKMQPGQKDEMVLPGGYGITYQTNGKDEVAPDFFAGLEKDGKAFNFAASAVGIKKGSTLSLLVDQEDEVVLLDSTGSEGVLEGKSIFIVQLTQLDRKGRISLWQNADVRLNGTKEEKAGFLYGEGVQRGKSVDLALLDKDLEPVRNLKLKPTEG